jgi:hypothetical protein
MRYSLFSFLNPHARLFRYFDARQPVLRPIFIWRAVIDLFKLPKEIGFIIEPGAVKDLRYGKIRRGEQAPMPFAGGYA